jgi:hypothetical protein
MRRMVLLASLCLLSSAPAWAEDGWDACRAKPSARCLADLAFSIGKTLPDQDASRWKLAEQQSKDNLREGLNQVLSNDARPPSAAEQIAHLADLGNFSQARALLALQGDRAGKAQGQAALAVGEAAHGRLKLSREDLRRAQTLGRKLNGLDADQLTRYAALAQMELGSDDLAAATAGSIADAHLRFETLLALSQRQWQLKRKEPARASLAAAEVSPDADLLAIARQWRLFGDEEGFRRALDSAEHQSSAHKDGSASHELSSMAIDLSQMGDLPKVHDRISRLPQPLWRAQALLTLANALPPNQSGDAGAMTSEAADIASRLTDAAEREEIESRLVHAFALQGDRLQASKHLAFLKDPKRRADAFIDLASLSAPRDKDDSVRQFDQAKDEIQRMTSQPDQDIALRDLIWAERRAGQDDAARQLPDLIQDPLQHLLARAQLGDWSAFDKEAKTTKPSDHDLQAIATGHAMDGRFAEVMETVKRIGNGGLKAETLASAASLATLAGP